MFTYLRSLNSMTTPPDALPHPDPLQAAAAAEPRRELRLSSSLSALLPLFRLNPKTMFSELPKEQLSLVSLFLHFSEIYSSPCDLL